MPADDERQQRELPPGAKTSVLIFFIAIIAVVCYAMAISSTVGLIKDPVLKRDAAIMTFMLAAAAAIALFCKIDCNKVLNAATFKSGMSACVCVLGVAWLGTTFASAHIEEINVFAGSLLETRPWLLAVVLFFASMLLYSQPVVLSRAGVRPCCGYRRIRLMPFALKNQACSSA